MQDARFWIEALKLQAHPEGGYFGEVYRSEETISGESLPARYQGDRSFATGIYFLITGDRFSSFHRLTSDESWHFYQGSSLTIYMIQPDGSLDTHLLGPDIEAGERFQAVVPAGCWFAARVHDPDSYALTGCTVAPGFDFADFELGKRDALLAAYPQHAALIRELTRV